MNNFSKMRKTKKGQRQMGKTYKKTKIKKIVKDENTRLESTVNQIKRNKI